MNLVGTLAKVAIGVMVSRGVGKMMGGKGGAGSSGLGGLLGGLAGRAMGQSGGGLAGMLGSVLSGGGAQGGAPEGGLGGLLGSLGGQSGSSAGGMGDGGLGGLLNQMMGGQSAPEPTAEQNTQAEIMLRAMINAAKSDGGVDEAEQRKILSQLGDVTEDEVQFVRAEMAQSLDVEGFIRSVPQGLEQQVYVMSLLGIDLDSQAEARYLDQLASGLGISHELSNQIHEKVGVPALYA